MALRWIEGFEITRTVANLARRYTNTNTGGLTFVAGRLHGFALRSTSSTATFRTPTFTPHGTIILGFAIQFGGAISSGTSRILARIMDGNTELGRLEVVPTTADNTNRIRYVVGSTTLGTSSAMQANQWYYGEFKVVLATGATGSHSFKLNETADFSGSSVVTSAGPGTTANSIEFTPVVSNFSITLDDIYVCDGSGSIRNDFLGDTVVEGLLPVSDDTVQLGIFPVAPTTHFDKVDDPANANIDDDTTYVSSTADGQKDYYGFAPLAFLQGSILGLQLETQMRLTTSGTRNVHAAYKNAVPTEFDGATVALVQTSYAPAQQQIWEQDPAGGDWTVSDINNGKFGIETG